MSDVKATGIDAPGPSAEVILTPFAPCRQIRTCSVTLSLHPGYARLEYALEGDLGTFNLKPDGPVGRADGLWRDTCFEAFFIGVTGAYTETNASLSHAWNLYRFEDYRTDMRESVASAPDVTSALQSGSLRVSVGWELSALGPFTGFKPTVVLGEGSARHYFAPAHPGGARPDFHGVEGYVPRPRATCAPQQETTHG